jgi:exonuclease VII large subunit
LGRGYAIAYDSGEGVVSSITQVENGEHLRLQVSDGVFSCLVEDTEGS